jgi:hypothetical protein
MLLQILSVVVLGTPVSAAFHDFDIPPFSATVQVKVFNVGNLTVMNGMNRIVHPVLPGHESTPFPMYSFFVEHGASKKRLIFDLGLRKDQQNFPPNIASSFASGVFEVEEPKDITELLEEGGIALGSIQTVIWR